MSFDKLSTEVVLWILGYVQPEDAINLGKTCKRLYKMCQDHILWKQLAYQMCLTNGILIPHDFNLLTLNELRHMATAPRRMLKELFDHRQPQDMDSEVEEKWLYHKHMRELRIPSESPIDQMILIPGGRYMITLAYNVFNFWDLLISGKHPKLLKEWIHPTNDGVILTFTPTQNQKGMTIAVSSSSPSLLVTLYKLTFTDGGDVNLSSIDAPIEGDIDEEGFACWTVVGNRFAYVFESVVSIWDSEINKIVKWDTTASGECQEIIFDGDRVWLLCNEELLGWTIPEFRALELHLNQPAEVIHPEYVITIHSPCAPFVNFLARHEASWVSSQDWYCTLGSPLTSFDIVWTDESSQMDQVTTYSLARIYADNPSTAPISAVATLALPTLADDNDVGRTVDYTRHSGDSLIKTLYSFKTKCLNLIVSSASGTQNGYPKSYRVSLPLVPHVPGRQSLTRQEKDDYLHDAMHSQIFDPIAGRACRIDEGCEGGILIWEYLDFNPDSKRDLRRRRDF
ncbi:hypothetical protein CVT24_001078 [Panaeolus cyanescens]|uniref:F-box domain-containing protein n=1 Tax=Panaeolus cyanescens TaxID=181874 RepID=A0A409VX27_9AGAR|nr:hypothetical protein CVT24_001078 [Panaeolus cyanescens]